MPTVYFGDWIDEKTFAVIDSNGRKRKRAVNGKNFAAMLAGVFGIKRPNGKEVLFPAPEGGYVNFKQLQAMMDPRTLDAIEILEKEGSDISPIVKFLQSFCKRRKDPFA